MNILPYTVIADNKSDYETHSFTPNVLVFGHTSRRPLEALCNKKTFISKYVRDFNNRMTHYYSIARHKTIIIQKQKSKEKFDQYVSKTFNENCEKLMGTCLFLKYKLNDVLNSSTITRLNIIYSSVLTPKHLIIALQEISKNLVKNNF